MAESLNADRVPRLTPPGDAVDQDAAPVSPDETAAAQSRPGPREGLTSRLAALPDSDAFFLFVLAPTVGLCAGLGSVALVKLIAGLTWLCFVAGRGALAWAGPAYLIVFPMLGGLLAGPLIQRFAREAKGHGVPEVMAAVALRGGRIRPIVALIKTLASALCIGSGGSAGQEGPIVQIGATLGSTLGQRLKLTPERVKTLVACGAAGGISATFNAPMAGVFFAMEVILGEYGTRLFAAIVVSSVSASVVARSFLGNHPAFRVPHYTFVHPQEILFYAVLGVACAGVAVLFMKALYFFEDISDAAAFPDVLKPAVGGLLLGVMGWMATGGGHGRPEFYGGGYATIDQAMQGNLPLIVALGLLVFKILGTCFTLGSGNSGGIFAPSLFMGVMLGEGMGKMAALLYPNFAVPPGACGLMGLGAVFAGAAQAPISAILLAFEMSADYAVILPVMMTCVISTLLVHWWQPESIYTLKLSRRGVDIRRLRGIDLLSSLTVQDALISPVICVSESESVREAGMRVRDTGHKGFPVLTAAGRLAGIVAHKDIKRAMAAGRGEAPVATIAVRAVVVVRARDRLNDALGLLGERHLGRMPVVDAHDPAHLIGLVTRKSIISALHHAVQERAAAATGLEAGERGATPPRKPFAAVLPDGTPPEREEPIVAAR